MPQNSVRLNENKIYEIGIFRSALGVYLFYYQIHLLLNFVHYFGPSSMVVPDFLSVKLSILFLVWNTLILRILFIAMMILSIIFTLGRINRLGLGILFFLQISFHHANPLIIHEPQQLANLFLFILLFLPLKNRDDKDLKVEKQIVNILIIYLGIYYFLSGLKKLPDPLWLKGEALLYVLKWPMIGKDNVWAHGLLHYPMVLKILTYVVLLFEMSFIFLVFTRFRWIYICVGVLMHLGIYLTMDVGSFSQIMMVWYTLLVDQETVNRFKHLFKKKQAEVVLS